MRARIPVAVLGATGLVGQELVRLLEYHPWFELAAVGASERSAGLRYGEALRYRARDPRPTTRDLFVRPCTPEAIDTPIVLSALDSAAAGEIEPAFARAGALVVSNARNHRLEPDVPLIIPEVNADHLGLVARQRRTRGWEGAIVTNPNCATAVIALALAPLHEAFGLREFWVTTLQAVSGAGHPGVASLDILGNVIPWIEGEEEKIVRESRKIFGALVGGEVREAAIGVSAQATRVPVEHGHTACISARFARPVGAEEARTVLREWRSGVAELELPSTPPSPVELLDGVPGPEPRRHADAGSGMAVTVGRVREDGNGGLRLVALGHNLIRGAAGAAVLNAELCVASGVASVRHFSSPPVPLSSYEERGNRLPGLLPSPAGRGAGGEG